MTLRSISLFVGARGGAGKMTKRFGLSIGLLLSIAALQSVGAVQAFADSCPLTGSVQDLLNLGSGGCSVDVGNGGTLTFSNFGYDTTGTTPGATVPTASALNFRLLNGPPPGVVQTPNGNIPNQPPSNFAQLFGFDFLPIVTNAGTPQGTANFNAPSRQTAFGDIEYTVVATGTTMTGTELRISGQFPSNANGTPRPGVDLTGSDELMFCTAADGAAQDTGTCHAFNPGNPLEVSIAQGPVTDVNLNNWTSATVDKTFSAVGPDRRNDDGITYLTLARNAFAVPGPVQAPEPSILSLLGISLVAIGGLAWRGRKSVPDKAGDA